MVITGTVGGQGGSIDSEFAHARPQPFVLDGKYLSGPNYIIAAGTPGATYTALPTLTMSDTVITQSENGTVVQLESGDTLTVRLEEVPTSGYRWTVRDIDERILYPEESDFKSHPDTGIGGGGTHDIRFEARESGTTALGMVLRQEWEPDNPKDQFEITVNVHDAE